MTLIICLHRIVKIACIYLELLGDKKLALYALNWFNIIAVSYFLCLATSFVLFMHPFVSDGMRLKTNTNHLPSQFQLTGSIIFGVEIIVRLQGSVIIALQCFQVIRLYKYLICFMTTVQNCAITGTTHFFFFFWLLCQVFLAVLPPVCSMEAMLRDLVLVLEPLPIIACPTLVYI